MIASGRENSLSASNAPLAVPIGEALVAIIKRAYAAGLPFLIEGPHGVGKSESVHEAARQLGIPVIDRDLSILESSDLAGYPFRHEEDDGRAYTRFAPPHFLPKPCQPRGLLLLEELNRSSEATRHAALQILTARRIHDYELAPGWGVCSTINPRTPGKYATASLDAALVARFVRITVTADPQHWLAWARAAGGVHPVVTDYIALLDDPFEDADGLSNPRSWTYVSKLLHTVPDLHDMDVTTADALASAIAGLVGNAHATALLRVLLGTEKPIEPATILDDQSACWLATVRRWREEGRLDVLSTTLKQLLRYVRPQARASRVLENPQRLSSIKLFFSELPPDMTPVVRNFIEETGYRSMAWDVPEASTSAVDQRRRPLSPVARMKMVTAAARARNAATIQGRTP